MTPSTYICAADLRNALYQLRYPSQTLLDYSAGIKALYDTTMKDGEAQILDLKAAEFNSVKPVDISSAERSESCGDYCASAEL